MPGHILYDGPSLIDGTPIVVLSPSRPSTNSKTGAMLQTYILCRDIHPLGALRSRTDYAICGSCPNRPSLHRLNRQPTCYVNVGQGPSACWLSYRRGSYSPAPSLPLLGLRQHVRLGTYGDPCAVPIDVWSRLLSRATGWTGYTHQWQRPMAEPYRHLLMASVSSPIEADLAHSLGWRTFRIRTPDTPILPNEFTCPASFEAGRRLTCLQCLACSGTRRGTLSPRAASVCILPHGPSVQRPRSLTPLTIGATP